MLLLLDIDGVMVPAKSWQSPELLNDGFPAFSLNAVKVLHEIISEDTTVLLTTSHKSRFTIEQWKLIFQKRGLDLFNLKTLEENIDNKSRKDEILNWFNHNHITEKFIIIDDDKTLNDLPFNIKNKLILTSPLIGLTDGHLDEIQAALLSR